MGSWSNYTPEEFMKTNAIAMIITGVLTFLACIFISAPYGRYSASKGWGFLVDAKVAWFLMESPNLYMIFFVAIQYGTPAFRSIPNMVLYGCYYLHYINRSIVYPLRMKSRAPMPVSVMFLAFAFCCWNGYLQAISLAVVNEYPSDWLHDARFLLGLFIFALGLNTNIESDRTLMRLGEEARMRLKDGQEKKYGIPRGGLFEYVSCANYSAEILEWTGFAIACWSLSGAAFAFYTFTNIGPRAKKHHDWYLENFKDYPKERKAVIPFIW